MDNSQELKILKQVELLIIDTKKQLQKTKNIVWIGMILGWIGIFISIVFIKQDIISPIVGIIIAGFSGMSLGYCSLLQCSITQWTILKDHISEESIKTRIRQIDLPKT